MPKSARNYFGLNFHLLDHLPVAMPDGIRHLQHRIEKPVWRIPKFSKQLDRYADRRMQTVHPRAVLGKRLGQPMTVTRILPLSLFIQLLQQLNLILATVTYFTYLPHAELADRKLNRLLNSCPVLTSDARSRLVTALQPFVAKVSLMTGTFVQKQNTSPDAGALADVIACQLTYSPYFASITKGTFMVVTDPVAVKLQFLFWLDVFTDRNLYHHYDLGSIQTYLRKLQHRCPLGYARYHTYAVRQLKYLQHLRAQKSA